jgi:hypothetical protein
VLMSTASGMGASEDALRNPFYSSVKVSSW